MSLVIRVSVVGEHHGCSPNHVDLSFNTASGKPLAQLSEQHGDTGRYRDHSYRLQFRRLIMTPRARIAGIACCRSWARAAGAAESTQPPDEVKIRDGSVVHMGARSIFASRHRCTASPAMSASHSRDPVGEGSVRKKARSVGCVEFVEVVAGLDDHAQHVGFRTLVGEIRTDLCCRAGNRAGAVGRRKGNLAARQPGLRCARRPGGPVAGGRSRRR